MNNALMGRYCPRTIHQTCIWWSNAGLSTCLRNFSSLICLLFTFYWRPAAVQRRLCLRHHHQTLKPFKMISVIAGFIRGMLLHKCFLNVNINVCFFFFVYGWSHSNSFGNFLKMPFLHSFCFTPFPDHQSWIKKIQH